MKRIFAGAIFTLSLVYFSTAAIATNVTNNFLIKTLDGRVLHCEADSDVGKRGYFLSNPRVSGGEDFSASVDYRFVKCVKQNGKYEYVSASPLDSYSYSPTYGENVTVSVQVLEGEFKVSADQNNFKILHSQRLRDASSANYSFGANLRETLTAEQMETLMSEGKVDFVLALYTTSKVHIRSSTGYEENNVVSSGTFNLGLTATNRSGKISVKLR